MSANKVQFNLKNVHYALLTEGSTNAWGTPVAVKGAVSLTLDANGSDNTFYADGVAYYKTYVNNGYSGSLEMARLTDKMLKDIWGITEGATDKVLYEKAGVEPKPFALLFQIDGDAENEYYCFYRCLAGRPGVSANTVTDSKDPETQSCDISALPLITGSDAQIDLIKARTTKDTPTATKSAWFSAVQVPEEEEDDEDEEEETPSGNL